MNASSPSRGAGCHRSLPPPARRFPSRRTRRGESCFRLHGLAVAVALAGCLSAAQPDPALDDWLRAQASLRTWSATLTQTRTLPALQQPIETPGRLWFAAPNRFRWELGQPVQTIVLRQADRLLVVYPRLKRAERYPLSGESNEPWQAALALLETGFATSRPELERRFQLLSAAVEADRLELVLEPRETRARRFLAHIHLTIHPTDHQLLAAEMRFADGSSLRNDFANRTANPALPEDLFEYPLPPDFTVIDPRSPR